MPSNVGIGGNEVKLDANEAISAIPENKTLLALKLTPNTPVKPEAITGLQTVESVFEHFKPAIKVTYEDKDGKNSVEDIRFNHLGDFGKRGLIKRSGFLKELETESEQCKKIVKQLKSNKILKSALQDPEAKKALIETIETLIKEIDNAG